MPRSFPGPAALGAGVVLVLCLSAACSGGRLTEEPVDDQFGHRYAEEAPGGRRTVAITPPDRAAEYFFYPAVIDSVHIRPGAFDPALPVEMQQVPVEVLLKGAFPDRCTELHDVVQDRTGHILDVAVRIRRPKGVVCARMVRPYRFYLTLDGTYEAGFYTLKLNNSIYAFEVRPASRRAR